MFCCVLYLCQDHNGVYRAFLLWSFLGNTIYVKLTRGCALLWVLYHVKTTRGCALLMCFSCVSYLYQDIRRCCALLLLAFKGLLIYQKLCFVVVFIYQEAALCYIFFFYQDRKTLLCYLYLIFKTILCCIFQYLCEDQRRLCFVFGILSMARSEEAVIVIVDFLLSFVL